MILRSQNQFKKDYFESLPHAANLKELLTAQVEHAMPAGYQALFTAWVETYGDTILKWSAEERCQSFADYVHGHISREMNALIAGDKEKAKFASRGQAILVSQDGENFNQLITAAEITKTSKPVYVLSETLRISTTDLKEVMNEQSLLHVQRQIQEQGAKIKAYRLDDNSLFIEAESSRGQAFNLELDDLSNVSTPLQYQFQTREGQATATESQLPELFGSADQDLSISRIQAEKEWGAQFEYEKSFQQESTLNTALALNQQLGTQLPPELYQPAPPAFTLPQIVSAKARVARQRQQETTRVQRHQARTEEAQKQQYQKQQEAREIEREQKYKERRKQEKQSLAKGAGIGALMGGLGGGLMGFASWQGVLANFL